MFSYETTDLLSQMKEAEELEAQESAELFAVNVGTVYSSLLEQELPDDLIKTITLKWAEAILDNMYANNLSISFITGEDEEE